jgi:hypothetical protein
MVPQRAMTGQHAGAWRVWVWREPQPGSAVS